MIERPKVVFTVDLQEDWIEGVLYRSGSYSGSSISCKCSSNCHLGASNENVRHLAPLRLVFASD